MISNNNDVCRGCSVGTMPETHAAMPDDYAAHMMRRKGRLMHVVIPVAALDIIVFLSMASMSSKQHCHGCISSMLHGLHGSVSAAQCLRNKPGLAIYASANLPA